MSKEQAILQALGEIKNLTPFAFSRMQVAYRTNKSISINSLIEKHEKNGPGVSSSILKNDEMAAAYQQVYDVLISIRKSQPNIADDQEAFWDIYVIMGLMGFERFQDINISNFPGELLKIDDLRKARHFEGFKAIKIPLLIVQEEQQPDQAVKVEEHASAAAFSADHEAPAEPLSLGDKPDTTHTEVMGAGADES